MPNYPGTQNTDDNLYIGVNNLSTVLTDNPLTVGATTVNVSDTTGFPTVGIITIELEAIHYTGTTATSFTGCTRGFDGTTAASHPVSTTVFHDIPAAHHNVLKDEIKAVTDDLRDSFTGDLDDSVTPAATATDAKERLDHVATQLKNITGEADWKTAPANTISALETQQNTNETNITTNTNDITTINALLLANVKNILVNGGMEISQRGASFVDPNSGDFTLDQWTATRPGGTSLTINQESGASNIDSGEFSCHFDLQTATTDTISINQEIENWEEYKGKTVTLSCRMKTDGSNFKMRIDDGVGTSDSSKHSGGNTFETLTVTRTLDSSATKLEVRIGVFAEAYGVSNTYIDSVMLILGASATNNFVPEDKATAYQRAYRYYETHNVTTQYQFMIQNTGATDAVEADIQYKVEKATVPTVTTTLTNNAVLGNPNHTGLNNNDQANWSNTADNINERAFRWSSSATVNRTLPVMLARIDWTAEA